MKRLILVLLVFTFSFGVSYGLSFYVAKTGIDSGPEDTIYVGKAFTIEFYADFILGDSIRVGWSTPFRFYGFDSVKTLSSPGVFVSEPSFDNLWSYVFNPNTLPATLESWDGDLTNANGSGIIGDQLKTKKGGYPKEDSV